MFNVVEVRFHALDCDVLAGLGALGLKHFAKRAFAFLADESVL